MYFELSKDIGSKTAAVHDIEKHPDGARLKGFLGLADRACLTGHFVGGDSLTLADVSMFAVLHKLANVSPGCLAPYIEIAAGIVSRRCLLRTAGTLRIGTSTSSASWPTSRRSPTWPPTSPRQRASR
jgi:hypothetical protein